MLLGVSALGMDFVLKLFFSHTVRVCLAFFFRIIHAQTPALLPLLLLHLQEICLPGQAPIPPSLPSPYNPHLPPLWRNKLKAQAYPKINLNGGIKLKAKPREFYYVLMFELLTWIVLLKYE